MSARERIEAESLPPVSTTILAIDPGPEMSAWVTYSDGKMLEWAKEPNERVLDRIRFSRLSDIGPFDDVVAFEQVVSYGMPVGVEVFETCVWTGRFLQHAMHLSSARNFQWLPRAAVKQHLCHRIVGVNDAVIRQALIDRFGPGAERAIGLKASPGPLYGLAGDGWAALAVAVTVGDMLSSGGVARVTRDQIRTIRNGGFEGLDHVEIPE